MPIATTRSKSTPAIPSRNPWTKCCRACSPSVTISIPASSCSFTAEPPRRPQYPGLSEPSRLRKRAGDRGLEHRCLSEIAREIGADAGENRSVRRRHNKAFPGHGLAHVDIDPGGLENDVARDRRDRVAIGVAALAHPAAHEILVEALGGLTGGEALLVAFGEPVAAA